MLRHAYDRNKDKFPYSRFEVGAATPSQLLPAPRAPPSPITRLPLRPSSTPLKHPPPQQPPQRPRVPLARSRAQVYDPNKKWDTYTIHGGETFGDGNDKAMGAFGVRRVDSAGH